MVHILHPLSAILSALRRGEQVMQGEEQERRNKRRGGKEEGGRDRESDFQRDNEPLNDG